MAHRGSDIVSVIRKQIQEFDIPTTMVDVGYIVEASDGIARIHGLSGCKASELLEFPAGVMGIALNLEEDNVGAAILGDYTHIKEGDEVRSTGRVSEVPVGENLLGRVIDPIGEPLDGKGPINAGKTRPIEVVAPNVVLRAPVSTSVHTGIKALDSMIPIGRGQRELIIGDKSTGKSAIALDTIISQKGRDLICIYVAIGQKLSKVARVMGILEEYEVMGNTIIITASSSESPALQYIAPYAGCAIGEEFRDAGKNALIIYDDLSKHAWAYRQLSLLLRRPPGREAYPGDIFYLHSRLLERAAKLAPEYGGGSLTALPIIETQAGDVSAYIPTNVISITDGQIYLETDLFNAGIRPAVNAGLSVSRVGGSAQTKAMRKVAGGLRLDLTQYRELQAFAQFGTTDLDKTTKSQLDRGARIVEVLKQPESSPLQLDEEVSILYAVINGYLDDVLVDKIGMVEANFHRFMKANHPEIGKEVVDTGDLSSSLEESLKAAIQEFRQGLSY